MADRARRRRRRLSSSGEFDRVYREGRSHASRHLVVFAFPRADAEALPDGLDFVIVARPAAGELARDGGGTAIEEALGVVLDEAGLTSGGGPA